MAMNLIIYVAVNLICLCGCEYFLFVACLVFEICLVVRLICLYCRMMPKEILKLKGN
jgi:hypothetical protein